MSSPRNNLDRLREYERRNAHAFSGSYGAWREEEPRRAPRRRATPHPENTMAPPEDVVESRRVRRQHVNIEASEGNGNLTENLFLLLLLISSIYGLYRLTIYLLMQAN